MAPPADEIVSRPWKSGEHPDRDQLSEKKSRKSRAEFGVDQIH